MKERERESQRGGGCKRDRARAAGGDWGGGCGWSGAGEGGGGRRPRRDRFRPARASRRRATPAARAGDGKEHTFTSIDRNEYKGLLEFLTAALLALRLAEKGCLDYEGNGDDLD